MSKYQQGNEQIFLLAPQKNLIRLIRLADEFSNRSQLNHLITTMFDCIDRQPYELKITRPTNWLSEQIIQVSFEDSNNVKTEIKLSLTKVTTIYHLFIEGSLTRIIIFYDNNFAMKEWTWPISSKNQEQTTGNLTFSWKQLQQLEESFYIVKHLTTPPNLSGDLFDESSICSMIDDFENYLKRQRQYRTDLKHIKDLQHTKWLTRLTTVVRETIQMIKPPTSILFDRLSQIEYLIDINQKFPDFDKLNKILENLQKCGSDELQLMNNNHDTIFSRPIRSIWNETMQNAFQQSLNSRKEMFDQMDLFISNLCRLRSQMILSYAWASECNEQTFSKEDFFSIFHECEQIFSLLLENEGNKETVADCKRKTNIANRIYHGIQQTQYHWTKIANVLEENLSIDDEDDITNCFLESKLSRDAHIWCQKIIDTNELTIIRCEPQQVLLDFGIAVLGIHQHISRNIIIHNQLTTEICVKIERQVPLTSEEPIFSLATDESVRIAAQSSGEIEVLFKSISMIGPIDEDWMLIIDNNQPIIDAIRLHAEIIPVDIELEMTTIDFGIVPCMHETIKRKVQLKNHLAKQVRLTAELQMIDSQRSMLELVESQLILSPRSTYSFVLELHPNNNEEIIEADICLLIDAIENQKWIKVLADIKRPQLSIRYEQRTGPIENNGQPISFHIKDLYRGEQRPIMIELNNTGQVNYSLQLSSNNPTPESTYLLLNANTKCQVKIQISMPNNFPMHTFQLQIRFENIQRNLTTICFYCEATQADLASPPSINHNIDILEEIDKYKGQDEFKKCLKSREIPMIFVNSGQASAVVSSLNVTSRHNPQLVPLVFDLKFESIPFKIPPGKTEMMKIIYHPSDLRNIQCTIEINANCWPTSRKVECQFAFNMPKLEIRSNSIIYLNRIEFGKINEKSFSMSNKSDTHTVSIKSNILSQTLIKKIYLVDSSPSPNEQFIYIYPKEFRQFSIGIECDPVQMRNDTVELAQIEIESLNDLVMSIDGELVNRTIRLFIYGQMIESKSDYIFNEQQGCAWENLRLIPSSKLFFLCNNSDTYLTYSPLVSMTLAAYTCSNLLSLSESIPLSHTDWISWCTQLQNHSHKTLFTIEEFSNKHMWGRLIPLLRQTLEKSIQPDHYVFFLHTIQFYNSIENQHQFRLQLLSTINSAANIDEQYTMQSYIILILNIYEKFSSDSNPCQETLKLIHQCIGKDPLMPEKIKIFIDYIRKLIDCPTNIKEIEQSVFKCISPLSDIRCLLGSNRTNIKWCLQYSFLSSSTKDILISLLEKNPQALLRCHREAYQNNNYSKRESFLVRIVQYAENEWSYFSPKDRTDILDALLSEPLRSSNINRIHSADRQAQMTDYLEGARMVFDHFEYSSEFNHIEELLNLTLSRVDTRIYELRDQNKLHSITNSEVIEFSRKICGLQSKLDQPITTNNDLELIVNNFLKIVKDLLIFNDYKWPAVESYLKTVWKFVWQSGRNEISVRDIAETVMTINRKFDLNNNWSQLCSTYEQTRKFPKSWETMNDYLEQIIQVDRVQSSTTTEEFSELKRISNIIKDLTTTDSKEDALQYGYDLARFMMPQQDRDQIDNQRSHNERLSLDLNNEDNPLTTDVLKTFRSHGSNELQTLIDAFIHLVDIDNRFFQSNTSITSIIDNSDSFRWLDQITSSWLKLSEETHKITEDIFNVLSSILTSFYGLLISKDKPFSQHLFMIGFVTALSQLAYLRLNTHFSKQEDQLRPKQTEEML